MALAAGLPSSAINTEINGSYGRRLPQSSGVRVDDLHHIRVVGC